LKKNIELATSVKGVGSVIAAFMQVTTNNFTGFENGRKYACCSGFTPFDNTLGKYKGKTKVSHMANKRMKTLLSNGANSACKWDPELCEYYARKIDEGKEQNLAINSIRCKMVNRVFAVVKRQTPMVTQINKKSLESVVFILEFDVVKSRVQFRRFCVIFSWI